MLLPATTIPPFQVTGMGVNHLTIKPNMRPITIFCSVGPIGFYFESRAKGVAYPHTPHRTIQVQAPPSYYSGRMMEPPRNASAKAQSINVINWVYRGENHEREQHAHNKGCVSPACLRAQYAYTIWSIYSTQKIVIGRVVWMTHPFGQRGPLQEL